MILAKAGAAQVLLGKRDEALAIARRLDELHRTSGTPRMWAALVYSALGDRDGAFERLGPDVAERTPVASYVPLFREFLPLRNDPRYAALRRRMNL